jgi:type I restriction enzyme S subunit
VKAGWTTKRLGEIAQISAGNSAPQDPACFELGDVLFFRTSDAGRIRFGDIAESEDRLNELGAKGLRRFPVGTILFPKSGASTFLNHRVMLAKAGCVSSHLAAITANELVAHPRFVLYFLATVRAQDFVQDQAYPSLNLPTIGGIEVPVPTLPEQRRIVALLDAAFEGIATAAANAERNLQNARDLFESHLAEVFSRRGEGWVETTLGAIGKVSMCKRVFKDETSTTAEIPFYKIGTFGREPDAFIPKKLYEEYRRKYSFPKRGDVLLSASGTIGRRVIYDGEPAYFQDSNIVWIDNDESRILNEFLYHLYGACDWNPTQGATISRLYSDDLKQIPAVFPSSHQAQRRLASQFDALLTESQRLSHIYAQKQADLAALKQSLLHQAFAGEL